MTELTWRHHIAHYTFVPVVLLMGAVMVSVFPLWYGDYIPTDVAFASPWGALAIICLYIVVFGDYIMPKEMYRHERNNEE